jgi:FixJ family two-component response regulator
MPDQVNILVIDDEQIMRDGCSRILSRDGWTVISAENGNKGLEEIKARPEKIDVILLDLMMPGMSGMEVLDQVRTIDPNLLVIVITGYATVESAVEAMKKGAYDFIPKPFTPDQLRIVVRRGIEKRTLQKEAEFSEGNARSPFWILPQRNPRSKPSSIVWGMVSWFAIEMVVSSSRIQLPVVCSCPPKPLFWETSSPSVISTQNYPRPSKKVSRQKT